MLELDIMTNLFLTGTGFNVPGISDFDENFQVYKTVVMGLFWQ